MAKKNRDYDQILKDLKQMRNIIQMINQNGKKLDVEADAAGPMLKDRVGKKDCAEIKEVAQTIIKVTNSGDNEIGELEREIKREKQKFEELGR